jgi:hypothetical protein
MKVVSFTSWPLYPLTIKQEAGWAPHSRVDVFKRKNSCRYRNSKPGPSGPSYSSHTEAGWAPRSRVDVFKRKKFVPLPEFETRTVRPIVQSSYQQRYPAPI